MEQLSSPVPGYYRVQCRRHVRHDERTGGVGSKIPFVSWKGAQAYVGKGINGVPICSRFDLGEMVVGRSYRIGIANLLGDVPFEYGRALFMVIDVIRCPPRNRSTHLHLHERLKVTGVGTLDGPPGVGSRTQVDVIAVAHLQKTFRAEVHRQIRLRDVLGRRRGRRGRRRGRRRCQDNRGEARGDVRGGLRVCSVNDVPHHAHGLDVPTIQVVPGGRGGIRVAQVHFEHVAPQVIGGPMAAAVAYRVRDEPLRVGRAPEEREMIHVLLRGTGADLLEELQIGRVDVILEIDARAGPHILVRVLAKFCHFGRAVTEQQVLLRNIRDFVAWIVGLPGGRLWIVHLGPLAVKQRLIHTGHHDLLLVGAIVDSEARTHVWPIRAGTRHLNRWRGRTRICGWAVRAIIHKVVVVRAAVRASGVHHSKGRRLEFDGLDRYL